MARISYRLLPLPIFVLVVSLLFYQSAGLNSEGQYLLDIKSRIGDTYNHLSNWNPNDSTPCGWKGVDCTSDYNPVVWCLDLSSMNLSGSLSPSLGGLVHLTLLNLSFNALSQNIPGEIGSCSTLNIANNRISGPFPDQIGNLSSLSLLIAYSNNITGPLPATLGNLKRLRTFRAGQNLISGSLPSEIGGCESLEFLGLFPMELSNCTYLRTLALYDNKLVGPIPKELGNLECLKRLYLYRNKLNGTIPREIGNLSSALEIDFSENELTGEIPIELKNIAGLSLLYIFENKLTGVIPVELTTLENLTKLDLSANYLTGTIPVGFQHLKHLIMLQLFGNSLSGVIPQGLGVYGKLWVTSQVGCTHCKPLVQLHLAENGLAGSFPSDLCKLANLSSLELDQNTFTGPIPPEIGQCHALQRLHLSGEIGDLSQLEILKLSENQLSENIPVEVGKLSRLTELQMGGNSFSGEIPAELGGISSLQIALNLSYNNLTGPIPAELGNLVLLEFLLLNDNHLSGEIPGAFDKLSSLLGCNFSNNDLTGPLPSLPLFQKTSISSFLGNKGLCGGPLGNCNESPQLSSHPSDTNGTSVRLGKIVAIISAVIGGISLILIIVIIHFMRRPVDMVAPLQDIPPSSLVSDIYFSPKDGFTFQDLVVATENFDDSFILGKGACGTVYKAVLRCGRIIAVKKLASNREGNTIDNSFQYAYTMKVTEKCDIYSYGVVLLELLTGRAPVQPLDQGGDLVSWDQNTIPHMITAMKIALLCTSMSPHDRPTMREVVLMLIESNKLEGHVDSSSFSSSSSSHHASSSDELIINV
ncbi:LEUCINE-RICH REPEAT RECEPTOR-LIKE PROTEIN KINASE FAMILY PROTEIN-RELATED [Salix koriyanagi]|uniref:LEUCINE-RICH REPEAT RECEPTOR-LIKE PROTEIN KINASE FAMILY PROTEIN-RELATED n=1 Tax=Salix koriyanagi TaxID=2511006 RepID=A0A9Q1A8C7_9ROSI|nr:LEUCINE-RICH REPEAT RECEPTOR-LIKE PROTEIN KINASE FAMILY PROTEIN-RELATED [Salix koriyanagi]